MAVALNSYASKTYSEHPISLWPMDDDSYYISLIEPSDRLFTNWMVSASPSVTINTFDNNLTYLPQDEPLPFEDTYSTIVGESSASAYTITAISPNTFSLNNVNLIKQTFCINFFLYQNPTFINWFKIGYRYVNNASITKTILSEEISPPQFESWINFNKTYLIPNDFYSSAQLIIQISLKANADQASRQITMNGLSVGQWSESICYSQLGSYDQELPDSINLLNVTGIPADQYGLLSDNGYYVVENSSILAQNEGPPIIFGTDNCTKIFPSKTGKPSFIFPGKGMLNESGRTNDYTLEMWMSIQPSTSSSRKILGPLNSEYGLYVKEGFLSLLIGNTIYSHYVQEWFRPMLVHIILKNNVAILMVNGEQVVSIPYNKKTIILPSDIDWWGFYSYSDIKNFEIDCVAIYPYPVSQAVAKRRFVWGQGTTSSQFIDDGFAGIPTAIDFSVANYTSNVIYPDIAQWNAASYDNLLVNNNSISIPNYVLPNIYLGGRNIDDWYKDNKYINDLEYPLVDHPKFVSLKPNTKSSNTDLYILDQDLWTKESTMNFPETHLLTSALSYDFGVLPAYPQDYFINDGDNWDDGSYIGFNSLNILTSTVEAVYAIFEIQENINETRPLIHFFNSLNNKKFTIDINGTNVIYSFNDVEIYRKEILISDHFAVGLNFYDVGQSFGFEISNFFSSLSSIQMLVGGDKVKTFEGKIYRVGFCNKNNYQSVSGSFESNGIVTAFDDEIYIDNFASYTLIAVEQYGRLFFDIAVSSTWEDYYPLSNFAGYVKDINGNSYYDVDFLQLNVGYPTVVSSSAWKYSQLKSLNLNYNQIGPNQQFLSYKDLKNNNSTGEAIDTSSSSLQMYVTFQNLNQNNIKPLTDFNYTKQLEENLVIVADDVNTIIEPLRVFDTKFQFKDGVILYPSKIIDFNEISVVFHFEIKQKDIISNPLKVSNFEITSRALNENNFNPIGTKFGGEISSYVKTYSASAVSFSGKEKNPISIYKRSNPYLYKTQNSGIKVIYKNTQQKEYISSVPVNKDASLDFEVGAIQLWAMYDYSSFSASSTLFEINDKDKTIVFIVNPDESGERGIITAINKKDNSTYSSLTFYQNGLYVKNPTIKLDQWNCLGILFNDKLDFNGYSGTINLFGGVLYNNISYYLVEGLGVKTDTNARVWNQVYTQSEIPLVRYKWQYWDNNGNWRDAYVLSSTSSYAIDPSYVYNSYIGTNRQIVDDESGFDLTGNVFTSYSSISWSNTISKPA